VKLEGIQNFMFYHLDIIIITLVVLDMSRSSYQKNVEIKVIEKPLVYKLALKVKKLHC